MYTKIVNIVAAIVHKKKEKHNKNDCKGKVAQAKNHAHILRQRNS